MIEALRTFLMAIAYVAGGAVLLILAQEGVGRFNDWRDRRKAQALLDDAGIGLVANCGDHFPEPAPVLTRQASRPRPYRTRRTVWPANPAVVTDVDAEYRELVTDYYSRPVTADEAERDRKEGAQ